MFAGGLGVHPTWAAELETGTETPGSRNLTVQGCNNLGCRYVEAPTCPIIMHDYLPRHWACAFPNVTSCLDVSSPHSSAARPAPRVSFTLSPNQRFHSHHKTHSNQT